MNNSGIFKLIISLALPLGIGAVAGLFTAQAVPEWYVALNKPSFNPPSWLFGPVWTILYAIMGISFFLIWKQERNKDRNKTILVYLIQLLLNFAWSFLFFYYKEIGWALIEIVVLWMTIIFMMVLFFKIKPLAAYLNIPYVLWVSFAALLNAAYFILN